MTPALYTLASLEAMTDRDLDAAVAEVVMLGKVGSMFKSLVAMSVTNPPAYSNSWTGFGLILDRMRSQAFEFDGKALIGSGAIASFHNLQTVASAYADGKLPRAAAIAAVLAVQGAA